MLGWQRRLGAKLRAGHSTHSGLRVAPISRGAEPLDGHRGLTMSLVIGLQAVLSLGAKDVVPGPFSLCRSVTQDTRRIVIKA